jgi:hypothetical protein
VSDKDFEALASIVVLLFIIVIILCPVIALWIYTILQNSRRQRIRESVLAARAELIGTKQWFPVRYASQPRFDLPFKILPWEAAGIMVVAPGSILFLGESFRGSPITLQFAPANSWLNWLGKCPWPNGAVSWLRIDTSHQKHYFSSETGIFIFGSHKSTRAIYDAANVSFGAATAQNN